MRSDDRYEEILAYLESDMYFLEKYHESLDRTTLYRSPIFSFKPAVCDPRFCDICSPRDKENRDPQHWISLPLTEAEERYYLATGYVPDIIVENEEIYVSLRDGQVLPRGELQ